MIITRCRIADNVTGPKFWPEYKIFFRGYRFFAFDQSCIKPGIYNQNFINMSLKNIYEWQLYDSTGDFPETYHEVYDYKDKKYKNFNDFRKFVHVCVSENTEGEYWKCIVKNL